MPFQGKLLHLVVLASHAHAFWRMGCSKIMDARMDPVVFPGIVSPHTHTIVGGSNIGIHSTLDSMLNSDCTSCEIQADKSAYWAPLLYWQYENGSFIDVHHDGSVVYYLGRGPNAGNTMPFPEGFKMVSGKALARSFDNTSYVSTSPFSNCPCNHHTTDSLGRLGAMTAIHHG